MATTATYDGDPECSFVQDVATGLEFMHRNGIIHCDVKPENVLLQGDGLGGYTAKVADLGGAMGKNSKNH